MRVFHAGTYMKDDPDKPKLNSILQSVVCPLVFLLLASCARDIDLELPITESQLVVESYLTSGDSLWVRVDESVSYYVNGNPTDRGRGATVEISIGGQTFPLIQHASDEIWIDNSTRLFLPTFYSLPKQTFVVPSSGTFDLVVQKDGRTVSASATMLPEVPLLDFRPIPQSGAAMPTYDAEITAPFPDGESYFVVQQRLQVVRNDSLFIDLIHMHRFVTVHSDGQPKTILVSNDRPRGSVVGAPGMETRALLRLMRIDKVYWDFYQATLQQENDAQVDFGHLIASEPTEIPCNIHNGLGIFTVMPVDTLMRVIP